MERASPSTYSVPRNSKMNGDAGRKVSANWPRASDTLDGISLRRQKMLSTIDHARFEGVRECEVRVPRVRRAAGAGSSSEEQRDE